MTDKIIERLKNTILIKAGDHRVKLGYLSEPPKVDCRVISEELYQEVLSILKKQIEEQKPKAKPDLREELIKFWETCEIARQTKEKVVDDYLNQTNKP